MQTDEPLTPPPGEPAVVWERVASSPVPHLERPREVPWPESAEEVARWEDPDDFGRIWHYYAPIFWVCLPLAALGYLIRGMITDPGDGWTGNLFDDDSSGQLWNFWLVWVGVLVWLVVAIGVLVLRVSMTGQVRRENEWIYRHGMPCTIHRSPYDRDGGESGRWPTFIALDHRLDDERAARIHRALSTWLGRAEVQAILDVRPESTVISSSEIFGPEIEGGWYVETAPGFGTADEFAEHRWILVTEPRDPQQNRPTVTTVPLKKKLLKTRAKLRRKAARVGPEQERGAA
ncbi:hypothetical protein OG909_14940 [Streptomyces sp. NBC_01754]|uniref:hypothetical protein n=1 Tax=Streptomyces sp. NBC_01754 TaxID=2975930 RepID=UPI002DDA475F|nr:hypothetical protein [Streptomyces sp. NBC_01754]WSC93475.1 hypothetical protein OG909_14940 [Streptomyces sp. NBC_01754]